VGDLASRTGDFESVLAGSVTPSCRLDSERDDSSLFRREPDRTLNVGLHELSEKFEEEEGDEQEAEDADRTLKKGAR